MENSMMIKQINRPNFAVTLSQLSLNDKEMFIVTVEGSKAVEQAFFQLDLALHSFDEALKTLEGQ